MSLPSGTNSFIYTVICYCMDSMQAVNSTNNTLSIVQNAAKANVTLSTTLTGIDINVTLTPDQMFKRAITLESFGKPYFILNTINITNINSTNSDPAYGNVNLILNDPMCSTDWCNGKGVCYLIDKNLACNCKDFIGTNCQIDSYS